MGINAFLGEAAQRGVMCRVEDTDDGAKAWPRCRARTPHSTAQSSVFLMVDMVDIIMVLVAFQAESLGFSWS